MQTRREAITTIGAAAALVGGLPACVPRPRSGGLDSIGLQLYTVRSEMRNSVERTLERVAEVGYKEVEFAGYFEQSARQIRSLLDANGLTAPASHLGLDQLENEWEATVDFAATVGHRYLVVAYISPQDRGDIDQYRRIVDRFNRVSERAQAAGLVFGYHNHDFEFEPVDGQVPFDIMLEHADPAVQFEMDLFWIIQGGGDPFDYFRRYPGRFSLVHVKDMAADGAMVDVGAGQIDFAALFRQRTQAGIRHYFVEHDNPDTAFGSIEASYTHLRQLEF